MDATNSFPTTITHCLLKFKQRFMKLATNQLIWRDRKTRAFLLFNVSLRKDISFHIFNVNKANMIEIQVCILDFNCELIYSTQPSSGSDSPWGWTKTWIYHVHKFKHENLDFFSVERNSKFPKISSGNNRDLNSLIWEEWKMLSFCREIRRSRNLPISWNLPILASFEDCGP